MYTPIIGLEIHLQLKTKSKVFCTCSTEEALPNTNICPICLGYPGAMPNLNREAVIQSIRMGYALHCTIAHETHWDRKSYMYPDLFKGYQISQLDDPICGEGAIKILVRNRKNYYSKDNYTKTVGLFRAHLEEDTAKSTHADNETLLDANKAGLPLLEIVSKPELYSVDEAVSFAKAVRNLARWFDVCEGNLELGQMRFDANISLCVEDIELKGKTYEEWKSCKHTPIVEIKNLNSFGYLQAALDYEICRQQEVYEQTHEVYEAGKKETRGWDEELQKTVLQRVKEEANEYRFIPEPDIPVLTVSKEDIAAITRDLPEEPNSILTTLVEKHVNLQAAVLITEELKTYEVFKRLTDKVPEMIVKVANLITNELATEVTENVLAEEWYKELILLLNLQLENKLSTNEFKEILKLHKAGQPDWGTIAKKIISTEKVDLEAILKNAFMSNPTVVTQIKGGKDSAKMFFVDIVMRETKGKANAQDIIAIIDTLINQ